MADNFLEHRMDDYRAGRLSPRPSKSSTKQRLLPDSLSALAGSRVFILSHSTSASEQATALARLLTSAGCKVAFTDTDSRSGNQLAQTIGAQCHPIDYNDAEALNRSLKLIESRWGGIDFRIECVAPEAT